MGRCSIDDSLRHAGASVCREHYQVPAAQAPRLVGLTDTEVAWLRANPENRYTRQIRESVRRLSGTPLSQALQDAAFGLVAAWRAEPDYLLPTARNGP